MNLFIRNFPEELHKTLKIMAINKGMKFYALIINILQEYIKHGHITK